MASLCFRDAAWARKDGTIGLELYLDHLLSHLRGIRHPSDENDDLNMLSTIDPVAASVKRLMMKPSFKKISETTLHQTVLKSSFDGDLESVATNYEKILGQDLDIPLQSMATAALIANKPKIFAYCLEKGVAFDQDIDRAAARVNNPEMLKHLYEADWRKIKSDHNSLAKLLTSSVGKSQHCVAFLLDQGAHILPETLSTAAFKPPSGADAATMALLLSRGGQQKDSGALQLAAGRGRLDIVKLLLAASANIDEIPANAPGDRMDGWPQTALHEAIAGSRTDVVRLLLDQGARWDLPDSKGRTALDLAESRGQGEIVYLIEAHKKADAAGKE